MKALMRHELGFFKILNLFFFIAAATSMKWIEAKMKVRKMLSSNCSRSACVSSAGF